MLIVVAETERMSLGRGVFLKPKAQHGKVVAKGQHATCVQPKKQVCSPLKSPLQGNVPPIKGSQR